MAFTKVLYHPGVTKDNENVLKNLVLYWDTIHTIIPGRFEEPFKTDLTKALNEAGILNAYKISPDDKEVQETISNEVKNFIDDFGGLEKRDFSGPDKPGYGTLLLSRHADSLASIANFSPAEVQRMFMPIELIDGHPIRGIYVELNERLVEYFNSLLATKISIYNGFGLITDKQEHASLSLKSKYTDTPNIKKADANIAEGLLMNLAIEGVKINPETPIESIIKFREKYSDELGMFRNKISELSKKANYQYEDERAFTQSINDVYINEVKPSLNNLEKSLKGFKIKSIVENTLKISLLSTSSSAFLTVLAGLSIPTAILAAAGLTLTATGVLYKKEKEEKIRSNPFSYLLEATEKLK